jgi:hypothetical protein
MLYHGRNRMAKIKRIWYLAFMQVRSCRMTVRDIEGMSHTVEVTASSVYEAVARGLATLTVGDMNGSQAFRED